MWPPALCSEDRSNERERERGGGGEFSPVEEDDEATNQESGNGEKVPDLFLRFVRLQVLQSEHLL